MHSKLPGRSPEGRQVYLVVAVSGRAIAEALNVCGYSVAVVDGFADLDTCAAAVVSQKVSRTKFGLDMTEALEAVQKVQNAYCLKGLFYDAALELAPDLLDAMAIDNVIGNSSATLRRCKDPVEFFSALDKKLIPHPDVSFKPIKQSSQMWLQKSSRSSGGLGITDSFGRFDQDPGTYFQKKMSGMNFSVTFLSTGHKIKVLGYNTLWSKSYGPNIPYLYEGAMNQADLTEEQRCTARDYTTSIACEFNLVGLNSIDFILAGDRVYVLEINPRIPATYELYETRQGNLIREHLDACVHAKLNPVQRKPLLRAHAIVYAPVPVQVPPHFDWPLWTADRPHPEEVIQKNEPVCSVFAGGKNMFQVRDMVRARKERILNKLMQTNK